MSIGQRIAELRKAKGWTQAQLAKQTQLSASTIAMYETNRRSPDDGALEKLASAFQIHTGKLLEQPSSEKPQSEPSKKLEPSYETVAPSYQRVEQVVTSYDEPQRETSLPNNSQTPSETHHEHGINLNHFALSTQEARIILFLRMNQDTVQFIESYITADRSKREQLEATWRLINEFHPS